MIVAAALAASNSPLNNQHDFQVVNDWARSTPWLHGFMTLYAGKGPALFAVLLLAGWWLARRGSDPRRMAVALWAALAAVIAVGVNQPIVNSVREQRPYVTLPHALLLVGRSADFSFPSDHATMAGAVAAGLLLLSWRLGLLATLAARRPGQPPARRRGHGHRLPRRGAAAHPAPGAARRHPAAATAGPPPERRRPAGPRPGADRLTEDQSPWPAPRRCPASSTPSPRSSADTAAS